jgi:hypothetical protein
MERIQKSADTAPSMLTVVSYQLRSSVLNAAESANRIPSAGISPLAIMLRHQTHFGFWQVL